MSKHIVWARVEIPSQRWKCEDGATITTIDGESIPGETVDSMDSYEHLVRVDEEPRCQSCDIAWSEHDGPQTQCFKLQAAMRRVDELERQLSAVTSGRDKESTGARAATLSSVIHGAMADTECVFGVEYRDDVKAAVQYFAAVIESRFPHLPPWMDAYDRIEEYRKKIDELEKDMEAATTKLACGHYATSTVTSVESGEKWCGECDMQSRLSDALQMEEHNKCQWVAEKRRRVYYQNIVYAVCAMIDGQMGYSPGQGVVCGTVDTPSEMTQRELKKLLDSRIEAISMIHGLVSKLNQMSDRLATRNEIGAINNESITDRDCGPNHRAI